MLKLGRITKVEVLFLALVFVFNFDLFKFSAAILEKGLLNLYRYLRKSLEGNPKITVTSSLSKMLFENFVYQMFSFYNKIKSRCFQISSV